MVIDSDFPLTDRSSTPCSPSGSSDECDIALTPTQLLGLAIKKRRNLLDEKERDFRRELLHSHLIQNICKYLGENRAKVRRQRRSWRKFGRRSEKKRVGGSERDQVVPDSPSPISGFESTVQNGEHSRHWRENLMNSDDNDECSELSSPRKRSRWDHCDNGENVIGNRQKGA